MSCSFEVSGIQPTVDLYSMQDRQQLSNYQLPRVLIYTALYTPVWPNQVETTLDGLHCYKKSMQVYMYGRLPEEPMHEH